MEQSRRGRAASTGPGNRTIATTLLELLAVRGRIGARDRALRALGLPEGGLSEAPVWLEGAALDRMLEALDLDAGLARAVGHRLCAPDATGLPLYGLGLATPEKAYRRIQALLPRASRESQWRVESMGDARAVLVFEPRDDESPDAEDEDARVAHRAKRGAGRAALLHCALRVGQLEAIPGLYGLLPARVSSSACLARGDEQCRYSVDWQRGEHAGLLAGAVSGLVAGLVALVVSHFVASLALGWAGLVALVLVGLGVAAGRAVDLHRQLGAVAGARRGHLALFDQVDSVLAEKLDQISRIDATLEQGPSTRRRGERESTFDEDPLAFVDLRRLVARSIEKVRPQVVDWAEIRFESDEPLRKVACEPVQIEQVVDELLQNAVEASLGAGESPEIRVALRNVARGVELSIEDQGQGIEANEVDETFDPFFDDKAIGLDRGFGLPVCLRIVEAHGGELRISNPGRTGTRVTILLPGDLDGSPEARED
ncbi:ATP-binding protein [Myxococcota bacterium]|nr:ATP-binding protein [Myxococcota bacterium]